MRIMALDIGTKRTGVALSDESETFSFPHSVIPMQTKAWIDSIKTIAEAEEVGRIVVGLPLNHHGEEGPDAVNIRKYIAALQERLSLPVVEWDERFSSIQAERMLLEGDTSRARRKEVVDKVAASILLQSYLDSLRFHQRDPWIE